MRAVRRSIAMAIDRTESAVRPLATSIGRAFASPAVACPRGHRDRLVTMAGLEAGTGARVRGV